MAKTQPAIPDYIGKLIGYRSWTLRNGLLYSLGGSWTWEPGGSTAACGQTQQIACPHCGEETVVHPAPQPKCSCGLYCFKDPQAYLQQLPVSWNLRSRDHWAATNVDGVVRIWGRCIEHRNGYRAEHAEIALLCTHNAELCKRYGAEQFPGTFRELVSHLYGETS